MTSINDQHVDTISDKDFAFLIQMVKERTGIILEGERHRNMMQGRLIRRLRALHIANFTEYCQLLKGAQADEEILHVINAVTTNVTSFFREAHHFEHLKQVISENESSRIRIWSAACSSGEEPYSIAMTAADSRNFSKKDVKILATDIDTNILEKGKLGQYPNAVAEVLPAGYETKYTKAVSPEILSIKDELKQLVHFKQLNLLEDWPVHGPFDAIFCRNVFIYFNAETQAEITKRFLELLKPKGFLYIGHSENLLHMGDRVENVGRTIYRKVT